MILDIVAVCMGKLLGNRIMFGRLILAFTLTCSSAAAKEAQPFDFLGLTTSTTYVGTKMVADKNCKLKGEGEEECSRPAGALLGNVRVLNLSIRFNDGKLFYASGATYIAYFDDLKAALSAKYGPPNVVEDTPWRNKLPDYLSKEVAIWRFSDGVLELRRRGTDRDYAGFSFLARGNAPSSYLAEQPVNF